MVLYMLGEYANTMCIIMMYVCSVCANAICDVVLVVHIVFARTTCIIMLYMCAMPFINMSICVPWY